MHNVFIEEVNKIALSSNDNKRLQTFDGIISYPYGANPGKVYKKELLQYLNIKWLILMIWRMKIKQNITQTDHIFSIIHTEYGSSASGKTKALSNLINNQSGIHKVYL